MEKEYVQPFIFSKWFSENKWLSKKKLTNCTYLQANKVHTHI
jgi:hypothetical protein